MEFFVIMECKYLKTVIIAIVSSGILVECICVCVCGMNELGETEGGRKSG